MTEKNGKIKVGNFIDVEYTGTLANGSVFDSSEGRAPLQFEVGAGEVIPGFDEAVVDLELDQEKTVTINCNNAYGPVQEELVVEVARNKFPKEMELQKNMEIMMQGQRGERMKGLITKLADDKVTLDLNHPLAGKDLTFKIKVVGIHDSPPIRKEKGSCCGGGCGSCGEGGCSGKCSH